MRTMHPMHTMNTMNTTNSTNSTNTCRPRTPFAHWIDRVTSAAPRAHLAPLIAMLVAVVMLGGCSCQERIYVQNDTDEMLHVQLQLPKPDVPWACGCKCVYETLVAPGGVWTSARPGSTDQMDHAVEAYTDCGVVRARGGSSGMWTRFTVCGPLVDGSNSDPITLRIGSGGPSGLTGTAATKSGASVSVSVDEVP